MDRKEISKIVFKPNFFEIVLFGLSAMQRGLCLKLRGVIMC